MMDDTKNGNGAGPDERVANENAAGASPVSLEERLTAAEAEAADFKDKALRAMAEVENIRRRAQREREDAVKYAASNIARDLLSTADNLRRALSSVNEAQITDEPTKNLLAGVAATERARCCSPAIFSMIACCARRWSASPRGAARRRPMPTKARTSPPNRAIASIRRREGLRKRS